MRHLVVVRVVSERKIEDFSSTRLFCFVQRTFINMSRPVPQDSNSFYHHYIELAAVEQATELPSFYGNKIADFFSSLPAAKGLYAYAPGKWTLQQVVQHLLDVERIFVYRLLWIVRGGLPSLPGFDENKFADLATATHRSMTDLIEEWIALRKSTDRFIANLKKEELEKEGLLDQSTITANALCFITYGHILHHIRIIRERYLTERYSQ